MAAKLPSAPLVEVIFDLHWKLQGPPNTPSAFQTDPGYHVLFDAFRTALRKEGFAAERLRPDANPELIVGDTVRTQFLAADDQSFPMYQIGPGLFASNDGTDYTWTKFKKRTLMGVRHLIDSYPDLSDFSFTPSQLELRYVNSFDAELIGHSDLLKFVRNHTQLSLVVPERVIGPKCGKLSGGGIELTFPIRDRENMMFYFQLATASASGNPTIGLVTKVMSRRPKLAVGKDNKVSVTSVGKWLEDAHSISSPFFRSLVKEPLMKKFKTKH